MATWEDGPEYAPAERPAGYLWDEPPLAAPAPAAPPPAAATAPAAIPAFAGPADPGRPLAEYLPPAAEQRDGAEPFKLLTAALTPAAAEAASHDPRAPFTLTARIPTTARHTLPPPPTAVGPSPAMPAYTGYSDPPLDASAPRAYSSTQVVLPPGRDSLAPAPAAQPLPQSPNTWQPVGPQPSGYPPPAAAGTAGTAKPGAVTFRKVWEAATPGVLITLAVGALLGNFAILMFALAFVLSSRIRYRRRQLQICFLTGMGLIAMAGLSGWLAVADIDYVFQYGSEMALWICRIVFWVVPFLVWRALANRERPEGR
jgi:hypothetical protein